MSAKAPMCWGEFHRMGLRPRYPLTEPFYTTQWGGGYLILIIHRLIAFIFLVAVFGVWLSHASAADIGKLFQTYIGWSYAAILLYFLVGLIISFYYYCRSRTNANTVCIVPEGGVKMVNSDALRKQADAEGYYLSSIYNRISVNSDTLPIAVKFFWILLSIAMPLGIVIIVIHFGYEVPSKAPPLFPPNMFLEIGGYVMPGVLLLIDFCINAVPVRLIHMIYPMVFAIIYLIFQVATWSSTGNPILGLLDWGKDAGVASAVALCYIFMMIPAAQLLRYGVYRARLYIYTMVYGVSYRRLTIECASCIQLNWYISETLGVADTWYIERENVPWEWYAQLATNNVRVNIEGVEKPKAKEEVVVVERPRCGCANFVQQQVVAPPPLALMPPPAPAQCCSNPQPPVVNIEYITPPPAPPAPQPQIIVMQPPAPPPPAPAPMICPAPAPAPAPPPVIVPIIAPPPCPACQMGSRGVSAPPCQQCLMQQQSRGGCKACQMAPGGRGVPGCKLCAMASRPVARRTISRPCPVPRFAPRGPPMFMARFKC